MDDLVTWRDLLRLMLYILGVVTGVGLYSAWRLNRERKGTGHARQGR